MTRRWMSPATRKASSSLRCRGEGSRRQAALDRSLRGARREERETSRSRLESWPGGDRCPGGFARLSLQPRMRRRQRWRTETTRAMWALISVPVDSGGTIRMASCESAFETPESYPEARASGSSLWRESWPGCYAPGHRFARPARLARGEAPLDAQHPLEGDPYAELASRWVALSTG